MTGSKEIYLTGTGSVKITPRKPMQLAGYGPTPRIFNNIANDLFVKILTISEKKKKNPARLAIITVDLCQWPSYCVDKIREKLSEEIGVQADSVIFNASHTHSGPEINIENNEDLKYAEKIIDDTATAVMAAFENSIEGRLYFGKGHYGNLVNRRGLDRNGMFVRAINQYGTVDTEIGLIKVVDLKGKIYSVIFSIACHNTVMATKDLSGDWASFAREALEKKYKGATVLFVQGCGADVKIPVRKKGSYRFEYTGPEYSKTIGKGLAKAVIKGLQNPMNPITGSIVTKMSIIKLPLVKTQTEKEFAEPFAQPHRRMAQQAKHLLESIDKKGEYKQTLNYQIMTTSIGKDFCFIALSGETSVSYGLRLKARLLDHSTIVTGYTGHSHKDEKGNYAKSGYIPSFDIIPEDGYEVSMLDMDGMEVSIEGEDFIMYEIMKMLGEVESDTGTAYYYSDCRVKKYQYFHGTVV
jgi:hypothetical protein